MRKFFEHEIKTHNILRRGYRTGRSTGHGFIFCRGSSCARRQFKKDDGNDNSNNDNKSLKNLQSSDLDEETLAACGSVITDNTTLHSNLECDGNGLIVGASDVTINLNGYTIRSDEEAKGVDLTVSYDDNNGILVPNANSVTIKGPGAITGFERAITFTGSSDGEVTDLVLRGNEVATQISGSSEITITGNSIDSNKLAIVSESSDDGHILFNLISANEKQGIVLADSDDYSVIGNNVLGNGKNGIFVDAQSFDNSINLNNVFGHEVADINNANGLSTNINRNNFGGNNNCGISLPGGLC